MLPPFRDAFNLELLDCYSVEHVLKVLTRLLPLLSPSAFGPPGDEPSVRGREREETTKSYLKTSSKFVPPGGHPAAERKREASPEDHVQSLSEEIERKFRDYQKVR